MVSVTATSSSAAPWLFDRKYEGMKPETAEKSWRAGEQRRATEEAWEREDAAKGLKLTYFDQCRAYTRRPWILKGIVARGETSAWIAPPAAGKSALLTEVSVHCAAGRDWRGHKANRSCGVVIFALERADLYKRRLVAYQQRDDLEGLPIAVADAVIDLLNPACVETIVATVRDAEGQFGCDVGMIVVDTYSKGIAAGGGDEDRAKDHNRAAVNLRNVHARLNVHAALVGHTGKNEDRGARGSNAHLGDVDLMIQISGDTIKVAEVIKGNDQGERAVAEYRIELIELGRDDDGEAITTSIVSVENIDTGSATGAKAKKEKLTPIPKAALKALFELVADGEITQRPEDVHVPVGVTCVTLAKWRERLLKLAIINAGGGYREQFKRIHVTLKDRGFVGVWDDIAWPVT